MNYNENNSKRSGNFALILSLIIILILLAAVIVLAMLLYKADSSSIQTSVKKVQRDPYILADHQDLFNTEPNSKLLFYDDTFGEVWIPFLDNVPLNQYNNSNFKTRPKNNLKYYVEDNKIKSMAGIDVSTHQNDIDWEKVKASGVDFAMIRVGYRGYESGDTGLDDNYIKNIEGALAADIDVGVYFFSQAINEQEAVDESNLLLDAIDGYDISFPIVYDWEVIYDDTARTEDVSVDTVTNCAIAFCENVKSAGYKPMVYSSRKQAYLKYDMSRLQDYDFWLADFNDETNYYYDYQMWQYSSTGIVDGINGEVDLNISFVDYSGKNRSAIDIPNGFFDAPKETVPPETSMESKKTNESSTSGTDLAPTEPLDSKKDIVNN